MVAKTESLRALRGHIIIELESKYAAIHHGIIIAGISRTVLGYTGRVIAHTTGSKFKDWLQGQRVLVETYAGRKFDFRGTCLLTTHEDNAISIIPKDCVVNGVMSRREPGVQRCRSCNTGGEGNALMDGNGYCTVCRRNERGEKHVPFRHKMGNGHEVITNEVPVSISEEERGIYGGFYPEKTTPKGTIISHPGQKKRGSRSHSAPTMGDLKRSGYVTAKEELGG